MTEEIKKEETPNNVVSFDAFRTGKGVRNFEKREAKGEKVTQQEAFTAVKEIRAAISTIFQSIQQLAGQLYQQQQGIEMAFNNLQVMTKVLEDKAVLAVGDMDAGWDKYFTKPMEAQKKAFLDKQVEDLKAKSATDAMYADAIQKVREFAFQTPEVKDTLLSELLQEETRVDALTNIELNFPQVLVCKQAETIDLPVDVEQCINLPVDPILPGPVANEAVVETSQPLTTTAQDAPIGG
jgi:formylmethanofuran dehydrogenase subunit E-like metal-binding protein